MITPLPTLPEPRLLQLLDAMGSVRTGIVGDLMLDRYLIGDAERISPEAPVPVVLVEKEWDTPGGAANVAANAAALGAMASLVGVVGDDESGRVLRKALAALRIDDAALVIVPGHPTTTKTRIMARGQQVARLDREVAHVGSEWDSGLLTNAMDILPDTQVLLLEDYDKGVLNPALIGELIGAARNRGIPVVADPKERNFFAFRGATVLKPNRRELDTAFGARCSLSAADLNGARNELGVAHLLVTVGAEGLLLAGPDGSVRHSPSIARTVYDVSGAGDTITAWLGLGLAAGASVDEAAWLANLAAGVQVGKRGTATVSRDEVHAAWKQL